MNDYYQIWVVYKGKQLKLATINVPSPEIAEYIRNCLSNLQQEGAQVILKVHINKSRIRQPLNEHI